MHSILAPSGASSWRHCTGNPTLAMMYPEPESQDSRDGSAAHWVAAHVLNVGNAHPLATRGEGMVGQYDPAGTLITPEIYESARVYIDDVFDHISRHYDDGVLYVEHAVRAPRIHAECCGTLDAAWYGRISGRQTLILWDYKHGHKWVDPIWNDQLLCYFEGMATELAIDGHQDQFLDVQFRIVQPRCYTTDGPVQTFAFTGSDARPQIVQLHAAAEAALSADATVTPGAHCKYCPARHVCPALRKETMFALDYIGKPIPDTLTPEGISFELALLRRMQNVFEARLEAIETEALGRVQRGEFLPGFGLDRRQGKRKFKADPATVIATGAMFGVDLSEKAKTVTPAEAERRFKAAGIPDTCMPEVETPTLGPKLVSAADSQAVRVFARKPT